MWESPLLEEGDGLARAGAELAGGCSSEAGLTGRSHEDIQGSFNRVLVAAAEL